MKIALLCPNFLTYSGIDRVVEQQAIQFKNEGNDVSIFTFAANIPPPLNIKLYILGMPQNLFVQRIYRLFFPMDFIRTKKWVSALKEFNIIYSHQYPMNWLAYQAKKRYGIKYVYYNHGYPPLKTFPNLFERAYMKIIIILANWTIKKADNVISVSQYLRQELKLETGLDSNVIYNNVDTKKYNPRIDDITIRQRYRLGNVPVILFVGRVSPPKGIHLLINAFNIVKQQIPLAILIIVGKHNFRNYSNKLKKISNASVIFAEEVSDEDMPAYYGACNVYATATLWEGFDLPVAEAQACGKPIVAFNIGPHPEVVKIGTEGILVPVGDIDAMAAAIISFLKGSAEGRS